MFYAELMPAKNTKPKIYKHQDVCSLKCIVHGLQKLSVKSNFDVRRRKIGQISKVEVFS